MSKWTKRRPHISLGFIKVDQEAKIEVDSRIFSPTIGLSAEIGIEVGEVIIVGTIKGPTPETDPEILINVTIGETIINLLKDVVTIDKTIGGDMVTDKTIEIDKITEGIAQDKDTETGAEVGIDQEIIVMTVLEVETDTEMEGCNKDPELCRMTEKDLGPGPILELLPIETE